MKKILTLLLCLGLTGSASAASYFPPLDPPSYKAVHITTATTTLVFTGAGTVRRVCVNTPVAAGTVTVDDALTATTPTYAVITTPAAAGNPFCQSFDIALQTGLTIVTTGAQDVTVEYQN